jgi:ABC-type dipeptide/oligopeptide/nickel transport system permease subunit
MKNLTKKTGKILGGIALGIGSFFAKLWRHKKGRVGLILVGFLVAAALFAPLLTPYSPSIPDPADVLRRPSREHWLGTDARGIDIMAQIIYGTRVSLAIGLTSGICVTLLGAVLGIAAGYFGSAASGVIMRVVDVLLVIPTLPLIIILNKYVSASYLMMIAIFIVFGWCGTARVIRAQVLSVKNANYIKAAELAGASRRYIMFRHILPAVSHLLIMNAALASAGFMIAEAGLSFLGLGDPNAVSWGQLLVKAEGSAFTSRLWAWVLAPGAAIFVAVTGFMQIGAALEEIFNPKLSKMRGAVKSYKSAGADEIERAFARMEETDEGSAAETAKIFQNEENGAEKWGVHSPEK